MSFHTNSDSDDDVIFLPSSPIRSSQPKGKAPRRIASPAPSSPLSSPVKPPAAAVRKKHWKFTVYFDTKEKYKAAPIEEHVEFLNRSRVAKKHENSIDVQIGDRKGFNPGDVQITVWNEKTRQELVYGLFEIKRDGDYVTNVSSTVSSFESQLDALQALGNTSIPYVGVILVYDSDMLTDTMQKTAHTILARYQFRSKGKFTVHPSKSGPQQLNHIAEIVYRICENIANADVPIKAPHEMLESRNLRHQRKQVLSAEGLLQHALCGIPSFNKKACFVLAQRYKDIMNFADALREKKGAILDELTKEDLESTVSLGIETKRKLMDFMGCVDESLPAPRKKKSKEQSREDDSPTVPPKENKLKKKTPWAENYEKKLKKSIQDKKLSSLFGGAEVLEE